jgi:hypothetical protein
MVAEAAILQLPTRMVHAKAMYIVCIVWFCEMCVNRGIVLDYVFFITFGTVCNVESQPNKSVSMKSTNVSVSKGPFINVPVSGSKDVLNRPTKSKLGELHCKQFLSLRG